MAGRESAGAAVAADLLAAYQIEGIYAFGQFRRGGECVRRCGTEGISAVEDKPAVPCAPVHRVAGYDTVRPVGVGAAEAGAVVVHPRQVAVPFVHIAYVGAVVHISYAAVLTVVEACIFVRVVPGRRGNAVEVVNCQYGRAREGFAVAAYGLQRYACAHRPRREAASAGVAGLHFPGIYAPRLYGRLAAAEVAVFDAVNPASIVPAAVVLSRI